jgi:3-hydroxyisobutyrate dehydrogenase
MKIGIAGVGRMGAAIAARLTEVGHAVTVWNRSAAKAKALTDAGAALANTPGELVGQVDVVITILTDPAAIDTVYHGPQGLLSGDAKGKLFVEMSTVRPGVQTALAAKVRATGAAYVECPVGGTTGPARQGKLFGFLAGEPADTARARPVLEQLCRRLEEVGPIGNGALVKFAINLPLMVYYQALGESLALTRSVGLAPERLMDMLADSSGGPNMMKMRAPAVAKMLKGEDAGAVTFDVAGCVKDLQSMRDEGKARGIALPVVEQTLACFEEAARAGLGAEEAARLAVYWSKK